MVYTAQMKNGVVVFDNGSPPEGAKLRIEVVIVPDAAKPPRIESGSDQGPQAGEQSPARPAIWDKLLKLAGTVKGLPPDMAENHDHYIHGAPKRKRQ